MFSTQVMDITLKGREVSEVFISFFNVCLLGIYNIGYFDLCWILQQQCFIKIDP